MGKKGKRSTKTGDGKPKQGPGKARRERAAAMKEFEASVTALIERLESETKDMELYGPLIEQEDCPICFLPLPRLDAENMFMPCCGQLICAGCAHASALISKKMKKKSVACAFCRHETPKGQDDKAFVAQFRSRAEKNDLNAIRNLAKIYQKGTYGLPKDEVLALRLNLRAAELGSLAAIVSLAIHFHFDNGDASRDSVTAMKLATIAAKKGDLESYFPVGCLYDDLGDVETAAKCWIFAARAGHSESMELLRTYKVHGTDVVSDDDFEAIEEAYKEAAKEEWSEGREAYKAIMGGVD